MTFRSTAVGLAASAALALNPALCLSSSHMDAPLITRDPAANTTDVYAFVQGSGDAKHLVVALSVYPHEEPGIGPNIYNFDDDVRYEIHVSLGNDVAAGRPTLGYRFEFTTSFKNQNTVLASYLGVVQEVGDANQNLVQTYTVTKVDYRNGSTVVLGKGIVPPNNQGIATPFYNRNNDGNQPARPGVRNTKDLDRYTQAAITKLDRNYVAFAGQRDDGFYGDINAIFDLLSQRSNSRDAQGGFNIHMMALQIPLNDIGGDRQQAGVYATTSRQKVTVLSSTGVERKDQWVQVARQGNPLFNEGLVAVADKERYSRTSPAEDAKLFRKYAEFPELGNLINALFLDGQVPELGMNRDDIVGIFIPDLIKVDLSTQAARVTGTRGDDPRTGFSRLSVFGGDTLVSKLQGGAKVPGGWPNGRRFGDDVVDIAISAIVAPCCVLDGDHLDSNDQSYNAVFPYEGTPQNGRNHAH